MVSKIEVLSHWFFYFVGVGSGPATTEMFLKSGPCVTNIMYTTNPASNKTDNISCFCDMTFCLKVGFSDMACRGI